MKLSGADRAELENAGASEKLLEAMVNPASISPQVTPEAAAAVQPGRAPARDAVPPPEVAVVRAPLGGRPPADATAPVSTQTPAAAAPQPTDPLVTQVLQLLKAKQPEALILKVVQADRRVQHTITAADRAKLEDAGASENLISVIMNKATPANSQSARNNLVEAVLQLLKVKQPEALILRAVQADKTPQELSAEDRSRLKEAGASENLIEAIANAGKPAAAPNTAQPQTNQNDAKGKACQEEAKIYFANDVVAQAKAVLTCMGAK